MVDSLDNKPPRIVLSGRNTTICNGWIFITTTVDQVVVGSSPIWHPCFSPGANTAKSAL